MKTPATKAASLEFVDLRAQHDEVRAEIEAALGYIIDESAFIGGPIVEQFELQFASYVGSPYAVGVSSGTDAVRLALQAVGVGRDDAVVTVAHTFIGTTEGAEQIGAVPIFVDVDERARTMSPSRLAEFLDRECRSEANGMLRHVASGRRVGAILPVHLYGQSADMEPILALGARYGVPVVEDAAQAHGATYRFSDGRTAHCGAMGAAAAFSFYPGKNLGGIGEAGAVTLPTAEQAGLVRRLRDHGQREKYVHVVADGGNARLDAIQAAVLLIKLRRLDGWNAARRLAAEWYAERLTGIPGLELPAEMPYARHVWHLYVVQTETRDAVRDGLAGLGVPTGLHYPIPLHLQPAYAGKALTAGSLAVTERLARTCLSLPMHPHLAEEQVARVAASLTQPAIQLSA